MFVSHTSTLKLFYSLNPILEADTDLNNFKNFYSKNIKKYSFKGFLTVLNWLKNMMLFYKKSNISNSKNDPWEHFYKLYSKQKGEIVDKFYFFSIPIFKRKRKR